MQKFVSYVINYTLLQQKGEWTLTKFLRMWLKKNGLKCSFKILDILGRNSIFLTPWAFMIRRKWVFVGFTIEWILALLSLTIFEKLFFKFLPYKIKQDWKPFQPSRQWDNWLSTQKNLTITLWVQTFLIIFITFRKCAVDLQKAKEIFNHGPIDS